MPSANSQSRTPGLQSGQDKTPGTTRVNSAPQGPEQRFSNDWFGPHESYWNEHLVGWGKAHGPANILEIGTYEGRSACWFLTHVMEHPESRLTCVDSWQVRSDAENMEEVFATFKGNIDATGKAGRVTVRRGDSKAVLPT